MKDVRDGPAKAKVNLLLWCEADQPEPWLIATTLSSVAQTKRYYRLRMGIEEMFKDLKGSFALEWLEAPPHLRRILRSEARSG